MLENNRSCPSCVELHTKLEAYEKELVVLREREDIQRREQEWIEAYSEWFDGPEGVKAREEILKNLMPGSH